MERYDCHCHMFNILTVGWKAILEQLNDAMLLVSDTTGTMLAKKNIPTQDQEQFGEKIKKLLELIRLFTRSGEKILDMLNDHYKGEYKLFPLMFDGDFLLDNDDTDDNLQQIKLLYQEANQKQQNPKGPLARIKQLASISDEEHQSLINFFKKSSKNMQPLAKNKPKKDGFTLQYEQIEKVASNPKYKDSVFPFLGVDPRRTDIKNFLPQVGKGKLFAGIKVYPPNGFSPYDKVLVGAGSIFEYCSKQGIPVVSHCSFGGFATPLMQIEVNGLIMPKGATEPKPYNGELKFTVGLKDGYNQMVKERAALLNDPRIWEEVLKLYPNLILVLAHFGSGNDVWQQKIIDLMKTYPNLHTDVSCMSEKETIQKVVSAYNANPEIRDRILYGSDYFLDMFFNDSFDEYLNRMKDELKSNLFDKFTIENPQKYMAKWYIKQ